MKKTSRPYSLRKSRHILQSVNVLYLKHWKTLAKPHLDALESDLEALNQAVINKKRDQAAPIARRLQDFAQDHFPQKRAGHVIKEFFIALTIALLIAIVIRQMWFEPYQIPTGSMRPSFKEHDHLLVSKTSFGLNIPLKADHFYFDPTLLQRTGVVILTAENLDIPDPDTKYFLIFNAKKRYIKRLIGLPGDTLYFYGGKIYGIDRNGDEITELRTAPWMQNLEHVPFSSFEGRPPWATRSPSPNVHEFFFRHMNLPIGKLTWRQNGKISGELLVGSHWTPEIPLAAQKNHDTIQAYTDFWGMRNFAIARLLTGDEVQRYTDHRLEDIEQGILYLELFHTPGLTYPTPQYQNTRILSPLSTLIPLQQHHLDAILDNIYTARFVVRAEKGIPYQSYQAGQQHGDGYSPDFPDIPDGTYEFYYGIASKIGLVGHPTQLDRSHPIYNNTPENIQKLFNLGIEIHRRVAPQSKNPAFFPSRYAYFRDGDLYLMGAPIFAKDDPSLIAFNDREEKRVQTSSQPYIAFKDHGPPSVDFIHTFGLRIPDRHYFVLGDNHAMSADSRYFGFVPEENLRGAPFVIVWPWDERFGPPQQVNYPFMTTPRLIVWGVVGLIGIAWLSWHRRRPLYRRISDRS